MDTHCLSKGMMIVCESLENKPEAIYHDGTEHKIKTKHEVSVVCIVNNYIYHYVHNQNCQSLLLVNLTM